MVVRKQWGGGETNNVSNGFPTVNITLHHSILINTECRQHIEGVFIAGINSIKDQADHNLLPCWASLVPEFRFLQVDDIADILHDTVQRSSREHFIFVVIRDGDQKLRVTVVHGRAQVITVA